MTSTKQAERARLEYLQSRKKKSEILAIPHIISGKNLNKKGVLVSWHRKEADALRWAKLYVSAYILPAEGGVGYDVFAVSY